jgi:hypothetical protein
MIGNVGGLSLETVLNKGCEKSLRIDSLEGIILYLRDKSLSIPNSITLP